MHYHRIKMKLLVSLLIYFVYPGSGEETMVSSVSSPNTVDVQVPESINPEVGLALRAVIKDPIEEGGGDVEDSPGGIDEKDEGKIHFTALVTGGEVKADTIAVGPQTVNHTMPLCFDPNPKDFSSLKFVKVTTISDLINDKGITFSLIKFDCSTIISKADDDTGVSASVIVIIVIVCLLLVIVGFGLYVYFAQPPTIVNWWNNLIDTHHDPENKEQTELPLLEGQTDNVKVVPCSMNVTNETDRNSFMKPGKEDESDAEKPRIKTVIEIKDNVPHSSKDAVNEGDSNAVTKPDSQTDKVHQISSDTNSDKEKGVNSNSDKNVQNYAVPQVISKAAQQGDLELRKKQLEHIEQRKANNAKKGRNSPLNKDKVNAPDEGKVNNPINTTNVVNNYVTNITLVGSDAGTLPQSYTDENVMNQGVGLPDEDIEMPPQSEVDVADITNMLENTLTFKK